MLKKGNALFIKLASGVLQSIFFLFTTVSLNHLKVIQKIYKQHCILLVSLINIFDEDLKA